MENAVNVVKEKIGEDVVATSLYRQRRFR